MGMLLIYLLNKQVYYLILLINNDKQDYCFTIVKQRNSTEV
jgi:hypothetical protein